MYNNLLQVTSYFKDNKKCIKHLEKVRWNDKPVCPFCNSKLIYVIKQGYKCGNCYKIFNVKIGTIFESSKVPLNKWFVAIYLETSFKKGISSWQLHSELNVTQKTAEDKIKILENYLNDIKILNEIPKEENKQKTVRNVNGKFFV